ncbi:MAG: hypothetical protein EOO38_18175 [Cytophagaceae bacterium]|nr:MAG: hypothetical protein EOO38_18175 [Cytophagaceae bacterium]
MLAVNDLVHATIIENGYWKDSCKGKIVGETANFWIVESHHWRFNNKTKRFAKEGGNLSKREPKVA